MKCSYCDQAALAKCGCVQPYMCPLHFGSHFLDIGNHPFESAKVFENLKINHIRQLCTKRIQDIEEAKNEIETKISTLISTIKSKHKKFANRLDNMIEFYQRLIEQSAFFESEAQEIENLEKMDIIVQDIGIDELANEIKKVYSEDLFTFKDKLQHRKIQFLNNHVGEFVTGVITIDGKILVTGGMDSTIRAWDLVLKKQIFVLHGHNSRVQCIELIEDLGHIISGSFDASVRIWSFLQRKQVAVLKGHKCEIRAISYIKHQSSIVSVDFNSELIIWSFASHAILKKIQLENKVFSMISMKSQLSIIVGVNSSIIRYQIYTTRILKTLTGHSKPVWSLRLNNDEEKLISGASDEMIIIWDLVNSKKLIEINGKCGIIRSIALTLNEEFIVTGSEDSYIRIWNLKTGKQVNNFCNRSPVLCILRVKDNFLSLSNDAFIGHLDIERSEFKLEWYLKPFTFDFVDFTSESGLIGYGSKNEALIWEMEKDKHVLVEHIDEVQFVKISDDARFAISGSKGSQKNLIYWDLKTNQKVCELKGHSNTVFCADFSKDPSIAASGSADKSIRIWNLNKKTQDYKLKEHRGSVYSIKFIDDKKLLISAGADKTVRIWRLGDKTIYAVLSECSHPILKVVVTVDEKFILSGDYFEGIKIWNFDEKREEHFFSYEGQAASWLYQNKISVESLKRFLKA